MSDISDFSENSSVESITLDEEPDSEVEESSSEDDDYLLDSFKVSVPRSKKSKKDIVTKKVRYVYAPKEGEFDLRISPKRMTQFEYASLIGHRAEMISNGGRIHPKYEDVDSVDLLKIAKMELDDRSIPFPLNIHRPIDNSKIIEVFNPREPGFLTPYESLTNHIDKYAVKNLWRVYY